MAPQLNAGERELRRRAILVGSLLGPRPRGPRRSGRTAGKGTGIATHWFSSDREKYDDPGDRVGAAGAQPLRAVRRLLVQLPHGHRRAAPRVAQRARRGRPLPHLRGVREALPARAAAVRADRGRRGRSASRRSVLTWPSRHVLIGGGPAAVAAAEAIRGADAGRRDRPRQRRPARLLLAPGPRLLPGEGDPREDASAPSRRRSSPAWASTLVTDRAVAHRPCRAHGDAREAAASSPTTAC